MANKIYSYVTIAGIVIMVPFVVAAGAFIGYLMSDWLAHIFVIPGWLSVAIIVFGLFSGIVESWRMLKMAIRLEKESLK